MQITSGWSKGLKILTPTGLDTRPTRERVRASAINMLQPWIPDAKVLDLFAGSGAIGLELLSRGASGCRFVEIAPTAIKCIKINMQALALRAQRDSLNLNPFELTQGDALVTLKKLTDQSCDLIWADPPYEAVRVFLEKAGDQFERLLSVDGVFALESSTADLEFLDTMTPIFKLQKIKQRSYGVSLITIWQKTT